jgi:hypothetical protein
LIFLDLFSVNSDNGEIILEKTLKKFDLINNKLLKIQCSNGIDTNTCHVNLDMVSTPNEYTRPVWLRPNPNNFNQCILLKEVIDSYLNVN